MLILVSLMNKFIMYCVIRSEYLLIFMVYFFKGWFKIWWNCEKMNLICFCDGYVYDV